MHVCTHTRVYTCGTRNVSMAAADGDMVGQLLVLRRGTVENHKVRAITNEKVYGGWFGRIRKS